MENSTFSEDNGQTEVCGVFNFEFKVALVNPSKFQFTNYVLVFITNIFLSLVTIFLNLTTILTFISSNQLQKKLCNFLIYLQSWNDLGIGVIVSPLFSTIIGRGLLGYENCSLHQTWFIIMITSIAFSVIILSAMNLERYASIVHPVYHRNKATKKKLLSYICSIFVVLGINALTILFFINLLHFISSVYIYVKIFLVGKAKFTRNGSSLNRLGKNTQNCDSEHLPLPNYHSNQKANLHNKDPCSVNHGIISMNQGSSSNSQNGLTYFADNVAHDEDEKYSGQQKSACTESEPAGNESKKSTCKSKLSENENSQSPSRKNITNGNEVRSLDGQCYQSYSQSGESNNHGSLSDNQSNPMDFPRGRDEISSSPKLLSLSSGNRKSEQEFLMKIKLGKSCMIVVICFFIIFLLPLIFPKTFK